MAPSKNTKNAELKRTDINEVKQIIIDLRKTIQQLSAIAARFEKSLGNYEAAEDEESFQTAEEDEHDNQTVQQKVKVYSRQKSAGKKETKKEASEQEDKNNKSIVQQRVKIFTRQKWTNKKETKKEISTRLNDKKENPTPPRRKSQVNEAINQTVVNNVEEEIRVNTAKRVEDLRRQFELGKKRSYDKEIENEETVSGTTINGEVNVNVQDLKKKFEVERKNLAVSLDKTKSEEKIEHVTEDEARSTEPDERVRKVLKYFQPQPKRKM